MGVTREEDEVEIDRPPKCLPGVKVRSTKYIRNDGTVAGREIGDVLVRKNAIGYVRDVGTFLQRYYVYAVEFIEPGIIVGMRERELALVQDTEREGAKP